MRNIKILVVTHKDYEMPNSDIYFPICVGPAKGNLKNKFNTDDTGDNISSKNKTYCELTAIYWAWKNLKADYIGVNHYRRLLTIKRGNKTSDALSSSEVNNILEKHDIILPKARRYPLTSIYKHYVNSLKGHKSTHKVDMQLLADAIVRLYPEYYESFKRVINGNKAHMLNMFIMKYDYYCSYCKWLFDIIDDVVAHSADRKSQRRYAGALSEFMLEVWLIQNKLRYKEVRLLELEKTPFINRLINMVSKKLLR